MWEFPYFLSLQTTRQFYRQYKEALQKRNLSSAPNITAYTYDALWTVAASLNKSIPKLEAMGRKLQDFYQNKTAMTKLFVQTIQDIHFLGVTVRNKLIFFHLLLLLFLSMTLLLQCNATRVTHICSLTKCFFIMFMSRIRNKKKS